MIIYNGFEPNERRTHRMRARKADKGHSLVEMTTVRVNDTFNMRYIGVCQCGAKFRSRQTKDRVFYAYTAHLKKEGLDG